MGVFKVCVLPGSSPSTCLLLLKFFCLLGMVLSVAVALQGLLLLMVGGWQQHTGALLQPRSVLQQPPHDGQVLLHSCQRCCPGLLTCAPYQVSTRCLISEEHLAESKQQVPIAHQSHCCFGAIAMQGGQLYKIQEAVAQQLSATTQHIMPASHG